MNALLERIFGTQGEGRPEITRRKDHTAAPLLEALIRYRDENPTPFTVPGHKRGHAVEPEMAAPLGPETYVHDVPILEGLDDRQMSGKVQEKAQELAADAWGADSTLFSDNGSSLSVQ